MLRNQLQDKRGQIRGIDFTISAFFFIIVLGQLIVVILNANILIVSQKKTHTTANDVDQLATKMFGYEGSPADWGDLSYKHPVSFGLAIRELASTGFVLDPRKLARLNGEANGIFGYSDADVNYDTIRDLLGLEANVQFHLTIRSALSFDLNPGDHVVGVNVSFLEKERVEGVDLTLFVVDLSTGSINPLDSTTTDSSGEADLAYNAVSLNFPHALIVVGQKGAMWGVSHFFPATEDHNALIEFETSSSFLFLTQNTAYSGSGIGVSDFRSTSQNHTFSYIYANSSSQNGLSYAIPGFDAHTTNRFLRTPFTISTDGFMIGIICVRDSNGAYQYRLGTLPALLDKSEEVEGIFPEVGPIIPDTGTKGTNTGLYFLTARRTLLVAELTIWEEL